MNERIWVNNRQPQTLYIAQILMYFNGAMAILFGGLFAVGRVSLFGSRFLGTIFILLVTLGMVAGAYGIANEKKLGYQVGVAAAVAPLAVTVGFVLTDGLSTAFGNPINLMFEVALVALLLHPMSSSYQRIWFK